MNIEKRKAIIQQLLKKDELVSVIDLLKHLDASVATIRKDLTSLEKDELIMRTHGGARLRKRSLFEATYQERERKLIREKQMVAKKAIQYIKEGDHIFINDGTTIKKIAKLMAQKEFPYKITEDKRCLRTRSVSMCAHR